MGASHCVRSGIGTRMAVFALRAADARVLQSLRTLSQHRNRPPNLLFPETLSLLSSKWI